MSKIENEAPSAAYAHALCTDIVSALQKSLDDEAGLSRPMITSKLLQLATAVEALASIEATREHRETWDRLGWAAERENGTGAKPRNGDVTAESIALPMSAPVTCKYHDVDVCNAFPDFSKPDREDILTTNQWRATVGGNDCDGIVALVLGPIGTQTLALTMGTDEARTLAAALFAQADVEDAKLDADEDEEEDLDDEDDA